MVWILYTNLNLSHVLPFKRNVDEFFVKIYKVGSYQFLEFVIPRHASRRVLTHEAGSMGDLGAKEDQSSL